MFLRLEEGKVKGRKIREGNEWMNIEGERKGSLRIGVLKLVFVRNFCFYLLRV